MSDDGGGGGEKAGRYSGGGSVGGVGLGRQESIFSRQLSIRTKLKVITTFEKLKMVARITLRIYVSYFDAQL